jgi:predicted nucleic acid-binding protein
LSEIVSNATPLIYLAKIGRLGLLKDLYSRVYISAEVKKEVVDKGKDLGESDALIIEKNIDDGWIEVYSVRADIDIPVRIDKGERTTLALAKKRKIPLVLIDDSAGRAAAELLGLNVRGTLYILLQSLKKKEFDYDTFLDILEKLIDNGFRLREEIYIRVLKEARKITSNK